MEVIGELSRDVDEMANSTDPDQDTWDNLGYRKPCCNQPKIQTKRPNMKVFCQKDANGKANSEDPDQTAPLGAV